MQGVSAQPRQFGYPVVDVDAVRIKLLALQYGIEHTEIRGGIGTATAHPGEGNMDAQEMREKLGKIANCLRQELDHARSANVYNVKPEIQEYYKGRVEAYREALGDTGLAVRRNCCN